MRKKLYILMAAVAIICMSVCVVSCSSDDEDNKRYVIIVT